MKSIISIFLLSLILIPAQVLAGGEVTGFRWLVGIPGLEGSSNFEQYINALYALAISVAALIAVVKIIIAGAKYMMSDIVSSKSEAKEDIRNSLIGLLIIIGAVIILNTVNSNLTNVQVTMEPGVFDDRPEEITLEEAVSRGDCTVANDCYRENCTDPFMSSLRAGQSSCRQACEAERGVYVEIISRPRPDADGIDSSVCFLTGPQRTSAISEITSDLLTDSCPSGETCYVEQCGDATAGYRRGYISCSSACTGDWVPGNGLGGAAYDPVTQACIFIRSDIPDETVSCAAGGACVAERNACSSDGGYVTSSTANPPTIVCRRPEVYVPPTAPETPVEQCPEGQTRQTVDGVEFCGF